MSPKPSRPSWVRAGTPWMVRTSHALDAVRDGLLRADLIDAAVGRVASVLPATPLVVRSERLDAWSEARDLQVTGAYKVRGRAGARSRRRSRAAMSSPCWGLAGNHRHTPAWPLGPPGRLRLGRPSSYPTRPRRGVHRCGRWAHAVHAADGSRTAWWPGAGAEARRWRAPASRLRSCEVIAGRRRSTAGILRLDPNVVIVPVDDDGSVTGIGERVYGDEACRRASVGAGPWRRPTPARIARNEPLRQIAPDAGGRLRVIKPGLAAAAAIRVTDQGFDDVGAGRARTRSRPPWANLVTAPNTSSSKARPRITAAALAPVPGRRHVAVIDGGNIGCAAGPRRAARARGLIHCPRYLFRGLIATAPPRRVCRTCRSSRRRRRRRSPRMFPSRSRRRRRHRS